MAKIIDKNEKQKMKNRMLEVWNIS